MKFPGREYEQDTTVNVLLLRRVNRVVRLDKLKGIDKFDDVKIRLIRGHVLGVINNLLDAGIRWTYAGPQNFVLLVKSSQNIAYDFSANYQLKLDSVEVNVKDRPPIETFCDSQVSYYISWRHKRGTHDLKCKGNWNWRYIDVSVVVKKGITAGFWRQDHWGCEI